MDNQVKRTIQYIFIIVFISLSIIALIMPYKYVNRANATNLTPIRFYYSENTGDLFFKNKTFSSDIITNYDKMRQFTNSFANLLEDEQDENYAANKAAIDSIVFSYQSEFFDDNSILVFCMRSNKSNKLDSKILNVDYSNKVVNILAQYGEIPNERQKDKYDYAMYFIPVRGKQILDTKIYFLRFGSFGVFKLQLQTLPILLYEIFILNFILDKRYFKKMQEKISIGTNQKLLKQKSDKTFVIGMVVSTIFAIISIISIVV